MRLQKKAYARNFDLGDVEKDLQNQGKETDSLHKRFKKNVKPQSMKKLYKEAYEDIDAEEEGINPRGNIYDEVEEKKIDTDRAQKKIERKIRSMSRGRSQGTKRELSEKERVRNYKLLKKVFILLYYFNVF